MNWPMLWDALFQSILFVFYLLAWVGFAIIIFAVLVGLIRGVASLFPRKLSRQPQHKRDDDPMI